MVQLTSQFAGRMFLSLSRKLLFIHVYKTGGSSVAQALRTQLANTQTRSEKINGRLIAYGLMSNWKVHAERLPQHVSAREVRDIVPSDVFARWFKFAFVRNPWSLQLSLYRHVLNSPTHPQHDIFSKLKTFDAYIEWLGSLPNGPHRVQLDFMVDRHGNNLLDYVGRFEHLSGDFASIANWLGFDTDLPHINRSGGDPDFRKFYSSRTREIVADLHRSDIEAFGYDFDTCALADRDSKLAALPSRNCCRRSVEHLSLRQAAVLA